MLVHQLETIEHFGTPHPTPRRPWLMRALLERTGFHVYFETVDRSKEVRVWFFGTLGVDVSPSSERTGGGNAPSIPVAVRLP